MSSLSFSSENRRRRKRVRGMLRKERMRGRGDWINVPMEQYRVKAPRPQTEDWTWSIMNL